MVGTGCSDRGNDRRGGRLRWLLGVSCGVVVLGCAAGTGAVASSSEVHGSGVSGTGGKSLTGSWTNPADGSPYQLQQSTDFSTLDASWHGVSGPHASIMGTFHGMLNSDATAYTGRMSVSEAGNPPVGGTMTMRIVSADELSVTYTQDNGVSGSFTLRRATPQVTGPAGNPLGLPTIKHCIDRRKFSFKLHHAAGHPVVEADIFINHKFTRAVTGANVRRLTLKRLPIGRFLVRIVATQDSGAQLISQRKYIGCKKTRAHTVRGHA